MKQKCLKCIFAVVICLMFFIIPTNKVEASTNEYIIENYDIYMVVNEDNIFEITETITANFKVPKHGIYRKIPLKNTVTRTDGTKSNNRAKITDISVDEKFTTSVENGYKVIKIGSSSKTLTGTQTYKIKYKYNIGNDPLKNADELYFNLIGTEWDTTIQNVDFKIRMPKSFDESLLGFSSGKYGSINSSNINYEVNNRVIKGSTKNALYQGQALTVRLTLPEGYFVKQSIKLDMYSIITIGVCIGSILIGFILWKRYGKDDPVIETVEFYPPDGYNSAEIGYMYEGEIDDKSAISLLVYLADKGYLKIEEKQGTGFLSSKGFKITKLKEYNGNNQSERIFFNGLFDCGNTSSINISAANKIIEEAKKHGETISFQDALMMSARMDNKDEQQVVDESDLYNSFYRTLKRVKTAIESKENKKKIFETSSSGKGKWIILMIIAIFLLITIKPVLEYQGGEALIFALLFPGIGFTVLFSMLLGKNPIAVKLFGLMWGSMFGGIPWLMMVLPALIENPIYFISYLLGIISVVLLIVFIRLMPKRTPYGNEILGKIRGFKRFLETAEKEELERLVNQNPEYFYNILPYTYALGVSDKWMKQFETIALKAPDWYGSSSGSFNMVGFSSFMSSTMSSAQRVMSSSPSSSSGGGSSGGGSSGGGSGGGGGGSW